GERSPGIATTQGAPEPRSLGRAAGGAGAPRRATHAVSSLGQVDQLEIEPERAHHALEDVRLDGQDVEGDALVSATSSRRDRALSRCLDELEDLGARLLDDDLAQQRPEEPHLPRERVAPAG